MEETDITICLKKIKKTKSICFTNANMSIKVCYKIAIGKIFFVRSFINF